MLPVPILLILLAASAQAEPPAVPSNRQIPDQEAGATFRSDTSLALLRFQVISRKDKLCRGSPLR
jgi:hypothetical protein